MRGRPWSEEESAKLKEGTELYGKDYCKLAEFIGTRTASAVASRYSKLFGQSSVEAESNQTKTSDPRHWTEDEVNKL